LKQRFFNLDARTEEKAATTEELGIKGKWIKPFEELIINENLSVTEKENIG
jgi:hypothetical protein